MPYEGENEGGWFLYGYHMKKKKKKKVKKEVENYSRNRPGVKGGRTEHPALW